MKSSIKWQYLRDFFSIFIPILVIEVIFRLIANNDIFDLSLIRIIIGISVIASLLTFIYQMLPNWTRKLITTLVVLFDAIYAIAQLGFYNFLGVYISLQNTSQLGAVTDYIKDFIASFKWYYFLPFIGLFISIMYSIFVYKKIESHDKVNLFKHCLISCSLTILLVVSYYLTLTMNVFESEITSMSNLNLFLTASNSSYGVSKFGTTMFWLTDVRELVKPIKVENQYIVDNIDEEETVSDNSRTIDDSRWNEVIDNTDNSDYQTLNNYFINQDITDMNDYTGLFEGKNVIFILMESVDDIFVEYPQYYPNFAKIINGGWYFDNNYSPRNSCATLNNEFSGMTSLYSISNICTAKTYSDNTYYEDVFNLFNDTGYKTFSAHDYTEHYYPRNLIHTNMGSGHYYGVEELGITYSDEYRDWANDDEFFSKVLDIISNDTSDGSNYMSWLTTVSSHQPYNVDSVQGNAYYSMTDGTGLPEDVRHYMSKLKILDNALGILLNGLEEKGTLDDTVLVLYGDHYPYGISTNNLNEALSYDTSLDMNAERVPFVIYNSEVTTGVKYHQYTTYVNILPTVANLFNLNYDPRVYMGTDLFSDDYNSMSVFADGSWKNEYAYYNASTGEVKYYKEHYSSSDIQRINSIIQAKLEMSSLAIETNYFNYLENSLNNFDKEISDSELCYTKYKDYYIEEYGDDYDGEVE